MKLVYLILVAGLLAAASGASAQSGTQEDLKLLEPLLNPDAPLLALWFCPAKEVPATGTEKFREFIYGKLFDRFDIRLLGRKTQEEKLAALDPGLQMCNCSDLCLEALGRGLESQRIIGVIIQPAAFGFRLSIKSQILSRQGTRQLNSVVEGTEQALLGGALEKALVAIFENEAYHAPLALAPAETKKQSPPPSPPPPAKQVEAAPPLSSSPPSVEAGRPTPGFFSRHRWSLAAGGLAMGCLAGALAFGALSQQIADQQHIQYDPGRDATGRDYATAANALFGVSAGAALGAVLLFFLAESPGDGAMALESTPGGALLQAAWCW
jgi:hypothetical protein